MLYRIALALTFILFTMSFLSAQSNPELLSYSDAIYFGSGSDKITPKYHAVLDKLAKAINSDINASAWIQAHADSLGSFQANEKLSTRRAQAIYRALAKRGVDAAKLKIDSHGEYVPFTTNGTSTGRALNRRVTVDVVRPYSKKTVVKEHRCIVKGKVINVRSKEPVQTKLIFTSPEGLIKKDSLETDADGNYEYVFDVERNIEIRAYAKGYFFKSQLGRLKLDEEITLDFMLEPTAIGGTMALSDLFFEGGTSGLLPSSENALNGVLAFMEYNTDLKIEIGGHINKPNQAPVLESSVSFQLSQARAQVVYQFLLSNGINKERLNFKGYGNSEMIYPRANTPVEEQLNRRVELKVIK